MKRHIGALATILSAIIFGFTPILARLAFEGGGNGITITFLRSVLAIPILYIVVKQKHIPLKLTRKECGNIVLFGVLGVTITTIALSVSYEYIPVGISTTLHFVYPILVTTASVLLFHDKVTKVKIIALFLGIVGVLFFLEKGANIRLKGVLLALFYGVAYTFYMLGIEKTYRYYAELLLVNAENGIVQHGGMLESSDNRNWMPGEISEEVYNLEIPEALEAGAYKLKIGLFENQKMQKRPIELALKDDIKDQNGYYEIAELIVE